MSKSPKLKPVVPRSLFSCGIFRNCTQSVLSPTSALHPSGDPNYALVLFRSLPNPDPFIFNTLISSDSISPLDLYSLMLSRRVRPNKFTFPCLLNRVADVGDVEFGLQVHASVVKFGFWGDGYVQNNLIHMYMSFGLGIDAMKVFEGMAERDVVTWTTLVSGYARMGLLEEAREVFDGMPMRSPVSWNAMIAGYVQAYHLLLLCFFKELSVQ